jgi:spermidine/putrescine transport system substrate-binding protein
MHVYHNELMTLKNKFDAGTLSATEYNDSLSEIFNRVDSETLTKAKAALLDLKKKAILEVDEGKSDIVKGILVSNLAWSGDAVYAMDTAEESEVYLNYTIPQEGSNVWFDGWCMPKGSNVEASKAFVNYLSLPEVAAKNMEATGYTSPLACDAIWDLVNDLYAAEEGATEVDEVDLSYFFGEDHKINVLTEERGRQFDAQYPDENTIARCAVMKDFGDEATEALHSMWGEFKAGN